MAVIVASGGATLLAPSLLSTSRSLLITLPLASLPAVPFSVPPASTAVPLSLAATGVSFFPLMFTVSTAVVVPTPSLTS